MKVFISTNGPKYRYLRDTPIGGDWLNLSTNRVLNTVVKWKTQKERFPKDGIYLDFEFYKQALQ